MLRAVFFLVLVEAVVASAKRTFDDVVITSVEDLQNFEVSPEAEKLTGQELVDYVNQHQTLWTVSSLSSQPCLMRPP